MQIWHLRGFVAYYDHYRSYEVFELDHNELLMLENKTNSGVSDYAMPILMLLNTYL